MRNSALIALVSLVLAACQSELPVEPVARTATPPTEANGVYIVVMRPTGNAFATSSLQSIVAASNAAVEHTYSAVFNGFSARMSDSAAAMLRERADVAIVEPDGVYSIVNTQTPAPWNLDRLDQTALPLDNSYSTTTTGNGVNVYIIDTGIRATHSEFGGRAIGAFSSISTDADDCNGHGTHVAGTIGAATFGVAKSVKLYAVKVLDCTGNGRLSGVLAGIDWVTKNAIKPAVANMSLGGDGISASLDAAVQASIASGITYTIAAGNEAVDACTESPARVPAALTVAATGATDVRAGFSNFGSCVDLFAPGVNIISTWNGSDTDSRYASGTSMAAPHVAGVAALYLETHATASPAEVAAALVAAADIDVVQDPSGSPNRLLSTVRDNSPPPAPVPIDQPPVAAFTASCTGLACAVDASTSTDDGQIVLYNWSMPGAVVSAAIGVKASPLYTTSGTKSITLTVTDNTGKATSLTQNVTVLPINQPPVAAFSASCVYLACAFDGSSSTDDTGIADYSWTWSGSSQSGTANGAVANFRFPATGVYTVVLTVRDLNGVTNSLSRTVNAIAANQAPSASISAPVNGTSVVQGTSILFAGSGIDPEDGTLSGASLAWSSSISGVIGTGASFSTSTLSVGTHVITLTVKDAQNAQATATRTVIVTAPVNQAPTASISSPVNGTSVVQGTSVNFVGAGSDAEDGVLSGISLSWGSSINGAIGVGTSFSTNALSAGMHTITLYVKDSQGATTSATVALTVTSPNRAPSASISAPSSNTVAVLGTSISFSGLGTDPEDGVLTGTSLTWTSSINGVIGTGASFASASLAVGLHTITLTAKDSQGATATATRLITVVAPNQPPTVSITTPSSGASIVRGTSVIFIGAANDPEDGALIGDAVVWKSDRDGTIGTSTSFSTSSLSTGAHIITLTAKDAEGLTGSAQLRLTVTESAIGTPAPSPTVHPPVASFTANCPVGAASRYCQFDASTSSDDSGIARYSWSFGDNRTDVLTVPTKVLVYPRGGSYQVTLTVTSNAGTTATVTQTVVVR